MENDYRPLYMYSEMANNRSLSTSYVGFWLRVWASLIDTFAITLVIVPLLLAIYGRNYFEKTGLVSDPLDFLISYILPAIVIVLFWMIRSATPGKMLISARIVDQKTGGKPSNKQFFIRYLAYYVSLLPFGLGMLWVVWDNKKQGWHDKIAGTLVIRVN